MPNKPDDILETLNKTRNKNKDNKKNVDAMLLILNKMHGKHSKEVSCGRSAAPKKPVFRSARQETIDVSSDHSPFSRSNGPYPTISVRGGKVPGGMSSTVIPGHHLPPIPGSFPGIETSLRS